MEKEQIYIGKINQERKYFVWHDTLNWEKQKVSHFVLGKSFSNVASYLEGATAHNWPNVEIVNGIPDEVRGRTYETKKVNKLRKKSFENLLDKAGLNLGGKADSMSFNNQIKF